MRAPEQLGPYRYLQSETGFPLGQDSLLLAAFVTLRRGDRVWDLGCGAGALLLLLLARESALEVTGLERDGAEADLARRNLADNGLAGTIRTGAAEELEALQPGAASLVISNPPYFRAGAGAWGGAARTEAGCTLDQWCAAAGRLLKNGGRFALVYRPERLAELFAALRAHGMEPKRLRLVQHGPDKAPSAVLTEAVRQGRPGLEILPTLLLNRR